MLKIYDKAQWHIDAGEDADSCVKRIKEAFEFLQEKGMLSDEGKEMIETGIDSSISLNERMVTAQGKRFLERFYDDILQVPLEKVKDGLEEKYKIFLGVVK